MDDFGVAHGTRKPPNDQCSTDQTVSLWYLVFDGKFLGHCVFLGIMDPNAVQPLLPSGITHLIAVCGLLGLHLAAVFRFHRKNCRRCPPWFHALAKF